MLPLLDDSFLVVSYLDKGIYVDGWRLGIAPESQSRVQATRGGPFCGPLVHFFWLMMTVISLP